MILCALYNDVSLFIYVLLKIQDVNIYFTFISEITAISLVFTLKNN